MSQALQFNVTTVSREKIAIFMVWLFHVSAIIGISMGYEDWFVPKTPVNLTVILVILLWSYDLGNAGLWKGLFIFFLGGMVVEWIGVHSGLPFGIYSYGENLGPKVFGVPWFIGVNWAVLTLVCGTIASHWMRSEWGRIILGAALMVVLDFFLEHTAPIFDFWTFEDGVAPVENYLAWFGISVIFHMIYRSLRINGDVRLSHHLYLAQLTFFVWFYGFYHL